MLQTATFLSYMILFNMYHDKEKQRKSREEDAEVIKECEQSQSPALCSSKDF